MKKTNNFLTIITIIFGVILGVFAIAFFFIISIKILSAPSDVTNTRMSLSITYTGKDEKSDSSSERAEEPDYQWYETLEQALENDELIRENDIGGIDYKESDAVELLQVQTDKYLAVFFTRAPEEGNVRRIIYVILQIKEGKISQPFRIGMVGNRPGFYSTTGKPFDLYDCDDGVVFYIERELVMGRIFGTGENKIPVCFGMWDNEAEIRSLTIAGKSPEIIPVVAKEDIRYFWYFEDLEWADRLSEVDWSDYTYGEIIELLEIKYQPSE